MVDEGGWRTKSCTVARPERTSGAGQRGCSGRGSASTSAAEDGTAEGLKTLRERAGERVSTWWNQKAGMKSASPGERSKWSGGGSGRGASPGIISCRSCARSTYEASTLQSSMMSHLVPELRYTSSSLCAAAAASAASTSICALRARGCASGKTRSASALDGGQTRKCLRPSHWTKKLSATS